ncbi:ABC transporter permease [Nocardioides sp. B-3]|uniref:ABC transporter permease n=1 Tax=Nocardioides sp. B-3 TaxID=2895565 RepID=UPI002153A5C6|nr:ABC transporter permease [Nocardioides sp. B-3]UUZ60286.1 ABC transporter permease [Nocardioides sp. B-3]
MLAKQWPLSLAAGILLLLGWEAAGRSGQLPEYVLTPTAIVRGAVTTYEEGLLLPAIATSARRLAAGFAIGTGIGVVLGLVSGRSWFMSKVVDPLVSVANPMPKIALLPVFAVWLGFTDVTRVSVIALGCFFPVFINSASGTRLVELDLMRVADNVEASSLRRFFSVVLPAALPRVLVGMRIAVALSFVTMFASEIVVSPDGVGGMLYNGYENGRFDVMYGGLLVLATAGFLADLALSQLGTRLTRGQNIEAVGSDGR